ncbi:MAG: hypothetical protein EBU90_24520 [Proteobacteria bacterium]|nr:hypothetical protein [Pseudomonadota bacterium]
MSEIQTFTETISNPFHLPKPSRSIFVDLEMREYPALDLIYGFITNKMGFKLRKKHLRVYGDEQTHYKKYLKRLRWNDDEQFVSVRYSHSKHGYARIQADDSLSLALFKRGSRHAFCKGKYIDADIVNCHLQIFKEHAKLFGFNDEEMAGLIEYCRDPKYWRNEIMNHYKLKDRLEDDGSIILAKDQAKELCIRLAFGGELRTWKLDFNVARCQDLPIIIQLENSLKLIREEIWCQNQHIRLEIESVDDDFACKDENGKKKSLMAIWSQTKERLIQEECVAYVVRTYPDVLLRDIISSQDGMMILAEQARNINFTELFKNFKLIIKNKFGIEIGWTVKEFDEAINVPPCSVMPIDISLEDLEKGERHIAEIISPAFKSTFKYFNVEKEKYWYILTKNIWEKCQSPDKYRIIKVLQSYIDEEIQRIYNTWKKEKDEETKKELKKIDLLLKKHYEKVGKGNYAGTLVEYLGSLLKDNKFPEKLDKTAGKLVFNDCILDLRTGDTKDITPEDYISFTNDINYLSLKEPVPEKRAKIIKEFKKIFNNKDTHFDYGMSALGYSLTGDAVREKNIYCLKDGTPNAGGDNGKSLIFRILKKLFPKLVESTPFKVFEEKTNNAHKYQIGWKNVRILYCDEGSDNKVNVELVKQIGDGDELKFDVLYGNTVTNKIMFKLFLCSNKLFNVGKGNDAVFNRYREMIMCSHFDRSGDTVEDDFENLKFVANPNLEDDLMNNYFDDLIHFFVEYSRKYYSDGLPPLPVEFVEASAETKKKNNNFAVWFWKNFEICDNVRISMDDIMTTSYKGIDRTEMIKEIKGIGLNYIKDLEGFGNKTVDGVTKTIKGGLKNIKRKENDSDD